MNDLNSTIKTDGNVWDGVRASLENAVGIAWDGCHKIYVLLDETQFDLMAGYGYDPLLRVADLGVDEALEMLRDWFDESCGLRFISSVKTVAGDANDGFDNLIEQFEENL